MRGIGGKRLAATAAAAALFVATSGAQAAETVSLRGETLSVRAAPGNHRDEFALRLSHSGESFILRGDLGSPFPTGCEEVTPASPEIGLRCPVWPILFLRVETGGGDDLVQLGTHEGLTGPGAAGFAQRVLFPIVETGPGADAVESAASENLVRLGPGGDRFRAVGPKAGGWIKGGAGNDRIAGGPTLLDTLSGGPGEDTLRTGAGGGQAIGGGGADTISGGGGSDELNGKSGPDRVYGAGGEDLIDGGSGDDHLLGGAGFDLIEGGFGADSLFGGPGPDLMDGGAGTRDRCTLGPGARSKLEGCELSF